MIRFLSLLLVAGIGVLGGSQNADAQLRFRPDFTIGHGWEGSSNQGTVNLYYRVELLVRSDDGQGMRSPEWRIGDGYIVFVRMKNEIAIGPNSSGGTDVPFFSADVVGSLASSGPCYAQRENCLEGWEPEASRIRGYRALGTTVHRDIRLGQNVVVRTTLAGIERGVAAWAGSPGWIPFYQVAADAIGYKYTDYIQSTVPGARQLETWHGMEIVNGSIKAGLMRMLGATSSLRVEFGARADLAVGQTWASGLGFQRPGVNSDMQAYVEVGINLRRIAELYIRAGLNAICDSSNQYCRVASQFMGGANFIF